jgi:hypothetical protein
MLDHQMFAPQLGALATTRLPGTDMDLRVSRTTLARSRSGSFTQVQLTIWNHRPEQETAQ